MKQVVSVSLGSSRRDHAIEVRLLGEDFSIRRLGCDGDVDRAIATLRELDGRVDAIGLGGLDVYLYVAGERYTVQDGLRLLSAVERTPVVDGSGMKHTLEREAVAHLRRFAPFPLEGARVLMVSALDRFGMAEALAAAGCRMVYGDLMFNAGIPYPIRTVEELAEIARKLVREMTKLPIHMLYPVGRDQERPPEPRFPEYYQEADIIAGDFHLIRRYMPDTLEGKVILTNTTTPEDVAALRRRGVSWLVTTTPVYGGRSFGTNVMEAVLVALLGKRPEEITAEDYLEMIRRLDLKPAIRALDPALAPQAGAQV